MDVMQRKQLQNLQLQISASDKSHLDKHEILRLHPDSEYPSQLTLPLVSIKATRLNTIENSDTLSLQINVFFEEASEEDVKLESTRIPPLG